MYVCMNIYNSMQTFTYSTTATCLPHLGPLTCTIDKPRFVLVSCQIHQTTQNTLFWQTLNKSSQVCQ